ncbi:pseudouridine-5'-phosphatase [Dendroctonus ponderosae]
MGFKKVTHVIFDLDGLVLDSESGYEKIMQAMAEGYGKKYTPDVKFKLLGTTETDSAKIFIRELDLPVSLEDCLEDYYRRIAAELSNPPFMPGAKRLIQHLAANNVPIAIATSSGEKTFKIKTQNHQDIIKLFHHIVCGSNNPEVKNGKPAPDIFLICASKFPDKPDPEQILVFEDSPNGMRAGVAAGMQTVLVPDKGVGEELRKPATLVLDSLELFQPELFGLPAF